MQNLIKQIKEELPKNNNKRREIYLPREIKIIRTKIKRRGEQVS